MWIQRCSIRVRNVGWTVMARIKKNHYVGRVADVTYFLLFCTGKIHSEPIRFIPIHSEICIRANSSSSDSIRKKFSMSFDVNRLKINQSQSEIFNPNQNSIRFIPTQPETSNPNQFGRSSSSEWIRGQNDLNWIINPNNPDLGFIRIHKLSGIIRIQSLGLSRINFLPICMKRDWNFFSDWLGWVQIGSDTDFGINRIVSE